jgi:hypothetical protein
VVEEEVVAAHAETAPPLPRAVRILDQSVAEDPDRIVALRFLDRCVFGVLNVDLHGVRTVESEPAAVAAGERFQVAVVVAGAGI